MIVYTPLDLPIIEPDDWGIFWNIWNQYSGPMTKVKFNGAHTIVPVGRNDLWTGLDIYINHSYHGPSWTAPFYDIRSSLPKLYKTLIELPMKNIQRVRLASSKRPIDAHSDDKVDAWYPRAYFYYTSPVEQWYLTKPEDNYGDRTYITRPDDTNWFAYNDKYCCHGTDYDVNYPKILLQVFASGISDELAERSITKYKDYTINYD